MDDKVANNILSTKLPNEKKPVRRMTGNKKGRTIIGMMKAIIDASNMNEIYAGKAILTPPFFSWL
jgi:hypothetical protein